MQILSELHPVYGQSKININFRTSTLCSLARRREITSDLHGFIVLSRMASSSIRARVRVPFMKRIKAKGVEVIVYEPALTELEFYHSKVLNDLARFKRLSDVIVANRITNDIHDVKDKIYSRDLFGKD